MGTDTKGVIRVAENRYQVQVSWSDFEHNAVGTNIVYVEAQTPEHAEEKMKRFYKRCDMLNLLASVRVLSECERR